MGSITCKFSHGRAGGLRLKMGVITTALGPWIQARSLPAVLIVCAGAAWDCTVTRCSQDPTVGFRRPAQRRDRQSGLGIAADRDFWRSRHVDAGITRLVDQRKIIAETLRPPPGEDFNARPLVHALIPRHGDLFQNRCDTRIQPILLKHNGDVAFCWRHGSVRHFGDVPMAESKRHLPFPSRRFEHLQLPVHLVSDETNRFRASSMECGKNKSVMTAS